MKSWIFIAVLALAVCTCGMLIAQEEGSESPATSASVEQGAKEEAAPAKEGAEAPSTSATPSESGAPASAN